ERWGVGVCGRSVVGGRKGSEVGLDGAGNFVIAWASNNQDGSGWGIYAQRFDAAGNALGDEELVNTTTVGDQKFASVASDADGNYLITWSSNGQDPSGWGVFARQYTAAGQTIGDEFQVNTSTAGDQRYSSVVVNDLGQAMVVWSGSGSGDSSGIFSQRYAINGTSGEGDFVSDVYADENNPTGPTATAAVDISPVSPATVPVPVVAFAGVEQAFSGEIAHHLNPATPTSLRGPDFIDGVFLAGFLTEAGGEAPSEGTRHEAAPVSWEM